MRKCLFLMSALIIIGCSGTRKLTDLSELTIHDRQANKLIVDRKPDYGIDGRDGCVVMEEISMDITELSDNFISGKVFDSKSKKPLANAQLNLVLDHNGKTETIIVFADTNGNYKSELNGLIETIEATYIAYRSLIVDFNNR